MYLLDTLVSLTRWTRWGSWSRPVCNGIHDQVKKKLNNQPNTFCGHTFLHTSMCTQLPPLISNWCKTSLLILSEEQINCRRTKCVHGSKFINKELRRFYSEKKLLRSFPLNIIHSGSKRKAMNNNREALPAIHFSPFGRSVSISRRVGEPQVRWSRRPSAWASI